jgi:hypothetical protein
MIPTQKQKTVLQIATVAINHVHSKNCPSHPRGSFCFPTTSFGESYKILEGS